MSRYKVLYDSPYVETKVTSPLYSRVIKELQDYYTEIAPVFNRTGWYYDRVTKKDWIENFGRAWEYPGKMKAGRFAWTLAQLTYQERPYSNRELDALYIMSNRGLIRKDLATTIQLQHQCFLSRQHSKLEGSKMLNRIRTKRECLTKLK